MADERMPYQSEDEAYGALLGNVLNPPDEPQAQQATAQGATPVPTPAAAPDPRMAVPAGEPPNPTLKTRPAPVAAPAPAAPRPAAVPTPNTVTPSGNGPTAPAPAPQKSWADYVRASNDQAMTALGGAQSAASGLQNEPSATAQNAPLEAQRTALSQPLNPNDPNYKPGLGTRIVRGLNAARQHGAISALDPSAVGMTPYNAPNNQFAVDTARRTAQAANIKAQEDRNTANEKADSDRLKDIGTEQRAVATGYGNVAKDSTAQQNSEQKADYNQQLEETKKQLNDIKQQVADQGGVPKNYEQAEILAQTETDPVKKAQYAKAAQNMRETEIRKFQYANTAVGDADPRRQPMIDAATANVQKLNDFQWDADANDGAGGFFDPANPKKVYSPSEFTDMKNQIATKLDKDLTAKKMRPLGVRFGVKATTPAGAQPAAQPGAPAAAAPAAQANQQPAAQTESKLSKTSTAKPEAPPKATTPAPDGAEGRIKGSDGNWYWFKGNKVLERSN